MAVRIRMKRMGRRHIPFFRIDAFDAKTPRDGKSLENLGHYNPLVEEEHKKVAINRERLEYWIRNGAQVSEKVASLLKKRGLLPKKGVRENKAADEE